MTTPILPDALDLMRQVGRLQVSSCFYALRVVIFMSGKYLIDA